MEEVIIMGGFRKIKKILSFMLALSLGISCAFYNVVPVRAAVSYQGQGTESSPYLVETAAQLNGIRNNLSAHYKLANTIDMSSFGTLEPIGYEGEKFTGSFTCDTDSDGTPKYAIKNLKVYIDAGEKYGHKIGNAASYTDYVEGKNKWQAGLFGFTNNATIKNIALLNANVTNTVIGQNNTNKDYSVNPGQNSTAQSTGILVGSAVNTTIIGCMSSGSINSKSNNTGGLIGYMDGGSISNSYSTAEVKASGYWATGGLIGICNANVSSCYATGNVQGGSTETTTGGLIGQIDENSTIMVVSCYATGNISPDASGFSLIGYRTTYSKWREGLQTTTQNMLNCYTTGNVAGYSTLQVGDSVVENNNYILSSSTGRQEYFKSASMGEIKSALAACRDYDVNGNTPTLKNVATISDESKYAPGAVSAVAENVNGDETNAIPGEDGTTKKKISPAEVATLIETLPEALELTSEDKDAVKEAKRAYDSLTPDEKTEISDELTAKLTAVYSQAVTIILKELKENIEALPAVKKLTLSDYDKVMELYDDYEFIGKDNQEYLKKELRDKLLEAVQKMKELKEEQSAAGANSVSMAEWLLMIVLVVLIVLVLVFNVVWSVWIIKKYRRLPKAGKKKEKKEIKSNDEK